jgi:hypothetical protein
MKTIDLQYFRESGKYYTAAQVEVEDDIMAWTVCPRVRAQRDAGKLPGLVDGHSKFHVLLTMDGVPHLLPL